jgi:hypothetical protein
MRRLVLLLGLCLLLAFSASGVALAGTADATEAHAHHASEPLPACAERDHPADGCLGFGHCLTGTTHPFVLSTAQAADTGPALRARPAPLPPGERLERPPRLA